MVNYELEVVRFDAEDVIATSTVSDYSECSNPNSYYHLYVQSANSQNDLVATIYNPDGSVKEVKTSVGAGSWNAIKNNTTNAWYYTDSQQMANWTFCGNGTSHGTFNSGN